MERLIGKEKKEKKRIGIDARFYGPLGKGLGRYVQEIVDLVLELDEENEYVIFLNKDNYDEFRTTNPRVKKIAVSIRWYTLSEQITFPLIIAREKLDLMHFPHFNVPIFCPVKFVVTIHDLILTKFPTARASTLSPVFYYVKNFFYRLVIRLAVVRASKVIAVSEFTKNDIIRQLGVKDEKIEVTLEGVANLARGKDSRFIAKLDDKETLLGYNIEEDFLLYVGNVYPHKNLEVLVEVFSKFLKNKPNFRLVLVGKEDYFYRRLKDFARSLGLWRDGGKKSPVLFPGYVPDNKLLVLYRKACAYVFPSLYEGFGLPALEAMAAGVPVASSSESSMPEVLGDAAVYFNPRDRNDMLEKLNLITEDEDLRRKMREKGFEQVKHYNWIKTAQKTLNIYRKILNNRG